MNLLKLLLDAAKPAVVETVQRLKDNKEANLAVVKAYVDSKEVSAEQAVAKVVAQAAVHVPVIGPFAQGWVEAELAKVLPTTVEGAEADLGSLYDQAIAWAEKEEVNL